MVLSYSAVAQPFPGAPKTISLTASSHETVPSVPEKTSEPRNQPSTPSITSTSPTPTDLGPAPGPSRAQPGRISHLILDAGPLLSFTPLQHLADTFHTTPLVLAELRDPKAREHWERLKLSMDVRVENPKAWAMAKVIAFAKKTGDYAVLSQTDLSVIALTYQYEAVANGEGHLRAEPGRKKQSSASPASELPASSGPATDKSMASTARGPDGEAGEKGRHATEDDEDEESSGESSEGEESEQEDDPLEQETGTSHGAIGHPSPGSSISQIMGLGDPPRPGDVVASHSRLHDDGRPEVHTSAPTQLSLPLDASLPGPSDTAQPAGSITAHPKDLEDPESDGDEWITPSNVIAHRSRDLGLVTAGGKADKRPPAAACMTGDFAVQNVLLGIGLGLVGEGGKRISKVKSWVLRCHACFKVCKDSSRKFCPSCGNPTLLRTTVTTDASGAQTLHLKSNFQYRLRGSKFSIPDAKPGRAKGQVKGGTGLILREDQAEWVDAVRRKNGERRKEERRMAKGGGTGGWDDPDWLPEILTVGMSGKGRHSDAGLPAIGHGRRNPNQARRRK